MFLQILPSIMHFCHLGTRSQYLILYFYAVTCITLLHCKTCRLLAGYYVYMETSSPRHEGERAVLSTGIQVNKGQPQCLTFWYHMFGAHVNTLNVYIKYAHALFLLYWICIFKQHTYHA